jgi:methyl coenzyme M reductase subunit C-like uncharacterized protein (methanogenesis marker protein 7)
MASTSNKNSPGDYKMEQARFRNKLDYLTDKTNGYGVPVQTHFAGDGLIMGRIASENLAHNACDIESYLRGTGATNLVNPIGNIRPDIKPHQSLSIIERLPVIMPDPMIVQKNQRPYMN